MLNCYVLFQLLQCLECLVEVFLGMGGGEEVGLELGGGDVDSLMEHVAEVVGVAVGV